MQDVACKHLGGGKTVRNVSEKEKKLTGGGAVGAGYSGAVFAVDTVNMPQFLH